MLSQLPAQISGETGFPRGTTDARCTRPAAWRPWLRSRGEVGRLRPMDYGENCRREPCSRAVRRLFYQPNRAVAPRKCHWEIRIEPRGLPASYARQSRQNQEGIPCRQALPRAHADVGRHGTRPLPVTPRGRPPGGRTKSDREDRTLKFPVIARNDSVSTTMLRSTSDIRTCTAARL